MIDDGSMMFISNGEDFVSPATQESTSARIVGSDDIPNMVGSYVVSSLLGRGGFGEVRLGVHQLTGEKVALKFLRTSEIISMTAAERTVTEIQCLTALRHSNIIKLIQVYFCFQMQIVNFQF